MNDSADVILTDLIRSAWIIERARARVYDDWAETEGRFRDSATRAEERAEVIARSLTARGLTGDESFVEPHAAWIRNLIGSSPGEVPFGELFSIRLADWVDNHAVPFLDEGAGEMRSILDQEKEFVPFPDGPPAARGFEPLPTIEMDPPGDVRSRFAILADIHMGSPRGESMARVAVEDINRSGASFTVQLGDITDHGDEEEFALGVDVLGGLEMPYEAIMGNHDVYSYEHEELLGRDLFEKYLGRAPDGALVEHGGVRFALLDSAEMLASPFPPFNLVTGTFMEGKGGAVVTGSLSFPQHDLLADVAAPGSPPTFVFLHHPPQPFPGFPPILFGLRENDSGRLHAVCDSGNVWGIFAGHTHRNASTTRYGNVPVTEVAIPRDFPFGYGLVDVTDNGYYYRFVQLSDRDLIEEAGSAATEIHHRYGVGRPEERAFVWTKS